MSPTAFTRRRHRRVVGALLLVALAASTTTACVVGRQGMPDASIPPSGVASSAPTPQTAVSASATDRSRWWLLTGTATTLATGLAAPWSVVALDGGGALISERGDGTVRELTPDGSVRIAGIVPGVVSGGESGLHGLAVWQEPGGERWLYAYHGAAEDNRVVRMPLAGGPGSLSLGAADIVLEGIARARNHDGGRIAFGPDGFLYVATGDAGNPQSAQDPASVNGKILRVTPEGHPAPGNPFDNAVWSLGHRNVQGIAWTTDDTMWASEFGQNTWDELNVIRAGANYGWPDVEGIEGDPSFVDPVAVWATNEASPSGIAAVGDTVFIAGLRGERLWVLDTIGSEPAREPTADLVGEQGRLRDAVAAPDGSLWVLTNNTDGRGTPRAADDVLLRLALTPHG